VIRTWQISRIIVKQTNSNSICLILSKLVGTISLANYYDSLSSDVALHFNVSYWWTFLVVSCLKEVFC